jgi:hypothetical protein
MKFFRGTKKREEPLSDGVWLTANEIAKHFATFGTGIPGSWRSERDQMDAVLHSGDFRHLVKTDRLIDIRRFE